MAGPVVLAACPAGTEITTEVPRRPPPRLCTPPATPRAPPHRADVAMETGSGRLAPATPLTLPAGRTGPPDAGSSPDRG